MKLKRLLVFHPCVAFYRIDLFNDLCAKFHARVCLDEPFIEDPKAYHELIAQYYTFKPSYTGKMGKWAQVKYAVRQIRNFHPDVILVSEFNLMAVASILYRFFTRQKYRVVSICDDSYDMVVNDNDFSRSHRLARRLLASRLDELILVEPKVMQWYRQRYDRGWCFPIIRREETLRQQYEAVLPLSRQYEAEYELRGQRVFLFVGRLVKLKNVHTLIRAFHAAQLTQARLVVVGSGEEEDNLKQLAGELHEEVVFTGRLTGHALYAWYNVADCFVLPSTQEAFGAVTNEAMIAGCRCLVSELAGSQCLVKEGVNGAVFNPHDVADLTEKIRQTYASLPPRHLDVLRPSTMVWDYECEIEKLIERLHKLAER